MIANHYLAVLVEAITNFLSAKYVTRLIYIKGKKHLAIWSEINLKVIHFCIMATHVGKRESGKQMLKLFNMSQNRVALIFVVLTIAGLKD